MSLHLQDKTALSIRLISARFLETYENNKTSQKPLNYGRALLESMVAKVATMDQSTFDLDSSKQVLEDAYLTLTQIEPQQPPPELQYAAERLKYVSSTIRACDGSGRPSSNQAVTPACTAGIFDLIYEIESIVSGTYAAACDNNLESRDSFSRLNSDFINYRTWLTPPDNRATFKVNGTTRGDQRPRMVEIHIRNEPLNGKDLCHLGYVIFHELVCHGFQACHSDNGFNAHPTCSWSEGWMDKVALEIAEDWARESSWLPYRGETAADHLAEYHSARYNKPPDIQRESDQKIRRAARNAYTHLVRLFQDYGMSNGTADAKKLARDFSLSVNAHRDLTASKLTALSARLQMLLFETATRASVSAVAACLSFIKSNDFNELESILAASSSAKEPPMASP